MRVLGVQEASRHEVVFVQVTNPASKTMRLTRLDYVFAAQGETVSEGAVPLARELPGNSAVILEVPLIGEPPQGSLTLKGKLTAMVDQIQKSYSVSAQVEPTATVVE